MFLVLSLASLSAGAQAAPKRKPAPTPAAQPSAAPAPADGPPASPPPAPQAQPAPSTSDAELERQAQEIERGEREAAQKRLGQVEETRRADAEHEAQREAQRQLAVVQEEARVRNRQETQLEHDATVRRRTWGIVLLSGAAVCGGVAGYFANQTSTRKDDIKSGGLANGAAISDAADSARSSNNAALALGLGAGALAAIGLPLLLFNLSPPEVQLAATPVAGGGYASLSLRLR